MAIMDAKLELHDDANAFANGSNVNSTDVINFGGSGLEIGAGTPLYFNAVVGTTAFTGGTTLSVNIISDTDALQTGGTVIYTSELFAVDDAETAAGAKLVRISLDVDVDKAQFIFARFDNVGNNTAGTIDCWIDLGPQSSHDTQVAQS